MVDRALTFSLIQLVALALPAFAILLEMVVEAEFPYTHWAVPVTTAGMGLFLVAGALLLVELLLTTDSLIAIVATGALILGMISLVAGGGIIGFQTRTRQHELLEDE